jgi:hypothetical protein
MLDRPPARRRRGGDLSHRATKPSPADERKPARRRRYRQRQRDGVIVVQVEVDSASL